MVRLICFFLLIVQAIAWADDPIGKVIAMEGRVIASSPSRKERVLNEDSPIFENELIATGSNAKVQIEFSDGGQLNLIPNSEYRVKEYRYKKLLQKDRYKGDFIKGGFRSLSGSISKKNPDDYEVETPNSTIGIRGTVIEALIVGQVVYLAVESGRVILSNQGGSVMIGQGADARYAEVLSPNAKPQILDTRPASMEASVFIPPVRTLPAPKADSSKGKEGGPKAKIQSAATASISPGC